MKIFKYTAPEPKHDEPLFKSEKHEDPNVQDWSCLRCGSKEYEKDHVSMTGGILSRIFNYQNRRFLVYSCNSCHHTELFKAHSTKGQNLLDLMSSG